MSWPLSHDFNEAIQNPKVAFADPELKAAEPVVGAQGLPLPRSGNFADVYQVRGADGRDWAVKCFTRPVTGLAERYAKVSDALKKANLPFTVGFTFLADGIRVGGMWRPIVKMEWVEGLLLNQVVRDAADKPAKLGALGQMWVKLCKRLREAGLAHADLQHGNVLLVPGSRPGAYGLKLIDYDGVWVPALANVPSGESGHSSFQHPARAATRAYSPDVDRFPHLVVATALRGLAVGGAALWERYDNGDNLLFTEEDYKKPANSKAMRELWQTENTAVQALVGRLAVACGKPIPQTPWLDQLAPDGEPKPLDGAERREAAAALGIALPVALALPPETAAARAPEVNPFLIVDDEPEVDAELLDEPAKSKPKAKPGTKLRPKYREPAKSNRGLLIAGGLGLLLLLMVGVGVAAVVLTRDKPDETVQKEEAPPVVPPKPAPKIPDGQGLDPVVPKPKEKDSTPPVVPPKTPANLPPAGERFELRQAWSADDLPITSALHVVCSTNSRVLALPGPMGGDSRTVLVDAATGKLFAKSELLLTNNSFDRLVPLGGERFALAAQRAKATIPVIDGRTGQAGEMPGIAGPADRLTHQFVSPDGRYVAVGHGGPLTLARASDGKVLLELEGVSGQVHFTADGSRALVAEKTGKCRWFKLPSAEADGQFDLPLAKGKWQGRGVMAASADGSVLLYSGAIEGHEGACHAVDGRTGQVRASAAWGHTSDRASLSADGTLMALQHEGGGRGLKARVFRTDTGEVVAEAAAPAGVTMFAPTILPDGGGFVVLAYASADKRYTVVRHDFVRPGGSPPPDPVVTAVKERLKVQLDITAREAWFDPEGGSVVAFDYNQRAFTVVDARTGATRAVGTQISLHPGSVFPLSGGRVGVRELFGSKPITAVDLATGKPVGTLPVPEFPAGPPQAAEALRVSPDERFVALGLASQGRMNPDTKQFEYPPSLVRVIDTKTNKNVLELEWQVGWQKGFVAFSADSSRVLIVDAPLRGRWYKLPSGELEKEWKLGDAVGKGPRYNVGGVSRDGRVLLCSGPVDKQLRSFVLDGTTGERKAVFSDLLGRINSSLSADGTRAVVVEQKPKADERNFVIVDTSTGAEVGRVTAPLGVESDPVATLAADGRALVVADRRKSAPVVVYDLPTPGTPGGVAVVPPPPPGDDPLEAPLAAEPPALKSSWDAKVGDGKVFDQLHFAPDANAVFLGAAAGGFAALDKSGNPRTAGFAGLGTAGVADFFELGEGRFGTVGAKGGEVRVWDGKTGRAAGKHAIPDLAAGAGGATALRAFLAPDEKHLAVGRTGPAPGAYPDVPFKVFDAAGKKEELTLAWKGGTAHFTADSSRVLVAEWSGRFRWYKLPAGAADGAWEADATRTARTHQITGMSADGAVLGYNGPAVEKFRGTGPAVMDGKTGKLTRVFRDCLASSPVSVSADGRRAALIRESSQFSATFEVVDLATGARVGRARIQTFTPDGKPADRTAPLFALAPDGRALVVYHPGTQKVHLFDVPAPATKTP